MVHYCVEVVRTPQVVYCGCFPSEVCYHSRGNGFAHSSLSAENKTGRAGGSRSTGTATTVEVEDTLVAVGEEVVHRKGGEVVAVAEAVEVVVVRMVVEGEEVVLVNRRVNGVEAEVVVVLDRKVKEEEEKGVRVEAVVVEQECTKNLGFLISGLALSRTIQQQGDEGYRLLGETWKTI